MDQDHQHHKGHHEADHVHQGGYDRLGDIGTDSLLDIRRLVDLLLQVVLEQLVQRRRQGGPAEDGRNGVRRQALHIQGGQGRILQPCRGVRVGHQRIAQGRVVPEEIRHLRTQPEAEAQGQQASAHGSHRGNKSAVQAEQHADRQDTKDYPIHRIHCLTSLSVFSGSLSGLPSAPDYGRRPRHTVR